MSASFNPGARSRRMSLKYFVAIRGPMGAPFAVQIVHGPPGRSRNHSAMITDKAG